MLQKVCFHHCLAGWETELTRDCWYILVLITALRRDKEEAPSLVSPPLCPVLALLSNQVYTRHIATLHLHFHHVLREGGSESFVVSVGPLALGLWATIKLVKETNILCQERKRYDSSRVVPLQSCSAKCCCSWHSCLWPLVYFAWKFSTNLFCILSTVATFTAVVSWRVLHLTL